MVESAVDMLTEEAMEPWAVVPWAESWNTTSAASSQVRRAPFSARGRGFGKLAGKEMRQAHALCP